MKFLEKHNLNIFYFLWGMIFFFFILFGFCFPVSASGSSSSTIPYVVENNIGYNSIMLDRVDIAINWAVSNNIVSSDDSLLIWTQDGFYYNDFYQYYFIVNPYCEESFTSDFDYGSNLVRLKSSHEIFYCIVMSNGSIGGAGSDHAYVVDLLGNALSVSTSIGSYLPRYPFYYNGSAILDTNDNRVIVANIESPSINTGHASEPINDPNNIINDNGNPVSRPNKPSPTPFIWSTWNPPTIDTTSIETLLESIFEILAYGFDYLSDKRLLKRPLILSER